MHPAHAEPRTRPPEHAPPLASRAAPVLALCSALLLLLVAVRWRPLVNADAAIARTTHRWAVGERGLTHVFRVLTDWVWDPETMRLLCAAAVLWLARRRAGRRPALWVAGTCVLAAVLQQALKAAVGRPRPVWPDPVDSAGYAAFPSGHAMTATVVCGLLLWLIHRRVARTGWRLAVATATVSVVGVGLTRVWLGVHWASDVLGGWLLGATVAAAAVWAYDRRTARPEPARADGPPA
ncbi:phosphatase PAP2 family protein [Streptomyces naganishii]|uniref:phosphatase PAP2 family protein n=1 Tax=Streptomyces naganishii TaxID=285447 RepID=UPI003694EE7C